MRRLIAIEFVTLDGVVQAPGGPDEDPSGGFAHGGWIRPYADPVQSAVIREQMRLPFDLLVGRRTFEIWAPYWPAHADVWPQVQTAIKYVASNTRTSHAWQPSVFLSGDVAGKVAASFRLVEHQVTSTGVVLASYERAGAIATEP